MSRSSTTAATRCLSALVRGLFATGAARCDGLRPYVFDVFRAFGTAGAALLGPFDFDAALAGFFTLSG